MKRIVFILFLMVLQLPGSGQQKREKPKAVNQNPKIALADVLGIWHPTDSVYPQICFTQLGNSIVDLIGIKHGVGNYSFHMFGDSLDVHGLAANWPPYDCRLNLLQKNVLEIAFYQFHLASETKVMYKRK